MQEFKRQNDYSVSIFGANGFLAKYNYVGNLYKFTLFLNENPKFREWVYINVYARRSGRYLMRFYNGDYVPPFPVN